jgi:hypothetical protein
MRVKSVWFIATLRCDESTGVKVYCPSSVFLHGLGLWYLCLFFYEIFYSLLTERFLAGRLTENDESDEELNELSRLSRQASIWIIS